MLHDFFDELQLAGSHRRARDQAREGLRCGLAIQPNERAHESRQGFVQIEGSSGHSA
nr:hypothetical protein [Variovorax boronicumulans]